MPERDTLSSVLIIMNHDKQTILTEEVITL